MKTEPFTALTIRTRSTKWFYVIDANPEKFLSKGNANRVSYSSGYLATMSSDAIRIFDLP